MGLDMYLYGVTEDNQLEELGYWRKANAIHNWLSRADSGEDVEVSWDNLMRLGEICAEVLQSTSLESAKVMNGSRLVGGIWEPNIVLGLRLSNITVAESLLPTQDGFFWGSTAYDQGYWNDLLHTIIIINKILLVKNKYKKFIYNANW